MDTPEASAVTGSHVLVHGLNGVAARHLAVLLVHIVGARARIVADPDTKVLDLERVLLVDLQSPSEHSSVLFYSSPLFHVLLHRLRSTHLVEADDLAVGLLNLLQLGEEVPEAALRDDIVWREDAHAVELRVWVRI